MPPRSSESAASRRRARLIVPGVLLGLLVLFHGGVVWGSLVLCGGDIINNDYPWRLYWTQHGLFTGWFQGSFSGYPFFANIQAGVLYPPNWLFFAGLPVERTTSWLSMAHFAFGGWGFYRMARLRLERPGALLAAGLWMCGGYNILRLINGVVIFTQTLAWLPWIWWAADRCGSNPRATAKLALFGAMQILAGSPQVVHITWGGVLVWNALRIIFEKGARARLTIAAHTGVALLLAGLIAFPQLVATYQMTAHAAGRGAAKDWDYLTADSMQPRALLTDIAPEFFDAGNSESYWGTRSGYHEINAYLGIGALMLALFCFIAGCAEIARSRRTAKETRDFRWLVAFAFLFAIGLVIALGSYTPVYRLLFNIVPGFDLFRVPARWLVWCVCPVCLLAGWGLQRLIPFEFADDGSTARVQKHWLIASAIFLVVLGAVRAAVPILVDRLGLGAFDGGQIPEVAERIRAISAASATWSLMMAFAAGALGWALLRRKLPRVPAAALLCAVLLIDLLRFWQPFRALYPDDIPPAELSSEGPFHRIRASAFQERFFPESDLIQHLRALHPGRFVFTDDVIAAMLDQHQREMSGERPAAYGLESLRGYQPLQLGGYVDDFAPMVPDDARVYLRRSSSLILPTIVERSPLDVFNATHVLTYLPHFDSEAKAQYETMGLQYIEALPTGLQIWRNPHAAGWAWLSSDPGWPGLGGRVVGIELANVQREPDSLRFTVDVPQDGLILHFAEVDYPGWTINTRAAGQGSAVHSAEGRSIRIDKAGKYDVERVFRLPKATRWGLPVAAIVVVGCVLFAAWPHRQVRRDDAPFD